MPRRIVMIQGHPDPAGTHLGHALAEAYALGAEDAGHEVQRIDVAQLHFPWLRSKEEFDSGPVPPALRPVQAAIAAADHLVILYPLWLGTMPAVLKAFLEQVLRPGFAFEVGDASRGWKKRLTGKSARVVVTMGMPAWVYRWYFGAHGLRNLQRNIFGFAGIGPVRASLFGAVEAASDARRRSWLAEMRRLGQSAR
jgi:putative NADPH-quinone reductase